MSSHPWTESGLGDVVAGEHFIFVRQARGQGELVSRQHQRGLVGWGEVPEPQILIRVFGVTFDQVHRHGVGHGQVYLAQRQTVKTLAGDQVRLTDEVARGDYDTVVDAVEEPLGAHTLRVLCPY